jgi:hypothetical protein
MLGDRARQGKEPSFEGLLSIEGEGAIPGEPRPERFEGSKGRIVIEERAAQADG